MLLHGQEGQLQHRGCGRADSELEEVDASAGDSSYAFIKFQLSHGSVLVALVFSSGYFYYASSGAKPPSNPHS